MVYEKTVQFNFKGKVKIVRDYENEKVDEYNFNFDDITLKY